MLSNLEHIQEIEIVEERRYVPKSPYEAFWIKLKKTFYKGELTNDEEYDIIN